jgi:hypothetical protein
LNAAGIPRWVGKRALFCHLRVRNPTPEGRGLVRSRKVFSSAHLTRLSLETGYVRSEIGMLGCEASPNLYGNRLNLSTRVKEVLVTPNRSITLSRPT